MDDQYFVRTHPGYQGGATDRDLEGDTRGRPRYRGIGRAKIALIVLVVVVGGWLLWARQTEGGISARIEDGVDWIRSAVGLDDTDPTLRNAEDAFGDVYDSQGNYLVDGERLEVLMPEVDWSSDLDWQVCPGARAVVIVVPTAGGTRSRLLLDGERIGKDVEGVAVCPTDYGNPAPWER
ncbi:MAG: hypothetical protein M5U31_12180 [Acidimicrobiia bacterium]|nr:hypothetical protein [Acidimicrobiia bacterium]